MILLGYLFAFLYGGLCLLIGKVISLLHASTSVSRKVVHILVGFEWPILYYFMGTSVHFLVVCLAFLALLLCAWRFGFLKMIGSEEGNAPGTVYYALAMTVMALITLFEPRMMIPFGIGVFCTSFGDGFSALVGKGMHRFNPRLLGKKTLFGFLTVFLFSSASVVTFASVFHLPLTLSDAVAVGFFAACMELVTENGLDNISVTLGSSFFSYILLFAADPSRYVLAILLSPVVIAFARRFDVLTERGISAAILLCVAVSLAFGNGGFALLLAFLCLGIVADRVKSAASEKQGIVLPKHEKRTAKQVLANGAIPGICAVLRLIVRADVFAVAFVASLAEALADTAASGIGSLSNVTVDLFRGKKCEKGISGGMSAVGTLAGLCGAVVISCMALLFGMLDLGAALIASASGFCGMVFDSLLGSLMQVKYRCVSCGKITEKRTCCSRPTAYAQGIRFVGNSAVNFLSTLFASLLSCAFFFL